ncbi:RNA-guided endonuclease TnpB family protein, partial [Lactobacillus delbrueckii subsp. bulgaricus]|nr:hypothetical protein [Lactobacillus delbrueckii subsp. bulgaricus]
MTRKKRRTQTKTVRAYTEKLNGDELKELDELFTAYGKCRAFLYSQLCGINHMTDVANWYGPRDKIREHDGEIKKAYKKNKAQGL